MTTRAAVDVETGIWRAGSGVPSNSLGGAGDFYVDTASGLAYYKASSTYAALPAMGLAVPYAFKSALMNGSMDVWQRNTSPTGLTSANNYLADRWSLTFSGTSAICSATQSTTVPAIGQAGYLLQRSLSITVTTTQSSFTGSTYIELRQVIEGYNWRYFAQRALILSFWVRSSLTGVYCVSLYNSAGDRICVFEYTISVANTWEQKTLSVPASPSAGTWNYTNNAGLYVAFILANGTTLQTSTVGSWISSPASAKATSNQVNFFASANTFMLTAVQMELGSTATDFQSVPFDVELARCQRYYEKSFEYATAPASAIGNAGTSMSLATVAGAVLMWIPVRFLVAKRGTPTFTTYNPAAAGAQARNNTKSTDGTSTSGSSFLTTVGTHVVTTGAAGWAVGDHILVQWTADAEL